jgi:CRISPR/Cas system CSM-associated protein Csm3 (group 7 of RAMP superfamily)
VGDKDQWCLSSSDGLDDEPQIEAQLCRVCKVFGSPWFASRVSIRDLTVDAAEWFEQFEIRNGVAIDRDTGTAAEGLLYDFEVVPAGTSFNCRIVVENAEDWQLGLLCAGLAPFERGEASLGGGRSRGLGQVELSWTRRTIIDATSQDSALECLLGMTDPPAVDDARLTSWRSAFIDELKSGGQDAQAAAQ